MTWIYEWEKPCAPYYVNTFVEVFLHPDPFFLPPTFCCYVAKKHQVWMYYHQDSLNKAALALKEQILNTNFLTEYISREEKLIIQMHQVAEKVLAKKDPLLFAELWQSIITATYGVGTIRCFNRLGVEECEKWLTTKIADSEERVKTFSILVGNSNKSLSQRQQEDFYQLLQLAQKVGLEDETLKKQINHHLENYRWFPCGYENEAPWDEAYLKTELKRALDDPKTIQKIEALLHYHDQIELRRTELLKQLNPPREVKLFFDALSLFTYYKDYIRESLNRTHYMTRPFLELVSKRIGLEGLQCTELLPREVVSLLEKGERFKGELTSEQDYALIFEKTYQVLKGKKALEFMENISLTGSSEIKGLVASPGQARGKVKILWRPSDYHGEKDFILVASMTTPDLMLAARNALAIVTDEGGITCHAAIISREMNLPCIIGTGNGTKMLQDGDLVEVDAHHGTVKILKRANPK